MTVKQMLILSLLAVGSQTLASFLPDKKVVTVEASNDNERFRIVRESSEPGFPNFMVSTLLSLDDPNAIYCGEIKRMSKKGTQETARIVVNSVNPNDKNLCPKVIEYLRFLEKHQS